MQRPWLGLMFIINGKEKTIEDLNAGNLIDGHHEVGAQGPANI